MRDWTKRVGRNDYRFRAGTIRACTFDRDDLNRTIANVRWDEGDRFESGRRFPAALDLEVGDRVMLVEQVDPLIGTDGGWVLVTSVRAGSFYTRRNVPSPPGISFDAIKEETQALVILALIGGTAAMAAYHMAAMVGAIVALVVVLTGYGWRVRRRWQTLRLWRQSVADELSLIDDASALLGRWAGNLVREAASQKAGTQEDTASRTGDVSTDTDWWVLLEVARDAPLAEINAAGRRMQSLYHPDKNMHLAPMLKLESERIAQRINAALEQGRRERA